METQIDRINDTDQSPMLERVNSLSPKFKSNQEALTFYSKRLETIASNFNLNIDEVIAKAEETTDHNDDLLEALVCAKRIHKLRR